MFILLVQAALAAPEPSVTLAFERGTYLEHWTTTSRPAVELAGSLRFEPGLEASLGLRRLVQANILPATAFDLYLAGRAAPEIVGGERWRWTPAVGLELGLTGALRRDWEAVGSATWTLEARRWALDDPAYLSALIDPLHGAVGPLVVSLGALSIGSTLPSWGEDLRFALCWARLGVRW